MQRLVKKSLHEGKKQKHQKSINKKNFKSKFTISTSIRARHAGTGIMTQCTNKHETI